MTELGEALRDVLQAFVDARVDAPQLLARAQALLGKEADATNEILLLLAEGNLRLRLPTNRQALARRFEQAGSGETSYTELDLWLFAIGQTRDLAADASANPEVELVREIAGWSQTWEKESERPSTGQFRALAQALRDEQDAARCLQQMEELLKN